MRDADAGLLPRLGDAIAGHLAIGTVKGLACLLVAWICSSWIALDTAFGTIAIALAISYLVSEILGAIIVRPIVLKERRPSPGGVRYVVLPFAVSIMVSFAASYAVTSSLRDSSFVTVLVAACNAAEIIWTKPWVPGPSPEEMDAKFKEFKAMTKDHFADDVAEIKRRARDRTREQYYAKKAREEAKRLKRQTRAEDQR
ncbi:hypothetical protein [Glutamicibacter sp.]|uniref:hypothetical protein n=1 Tax=Glutamicibacter sp. TaxID=1931995 RepID=UPI003D6A0C12